ncbi:MAG: hypothetical protein KDJ74_04565 [Notoacmeibacter sp.]|nr:hypothetical protein [Notoacmeibacter sp.]MCB1440991.1 hypothetical protein [Nitratireductor sp.]
MSVESEWVGMRGSMRKNAGVAGMGMVRVALLFGSAAAALTLILTPLADSQSRKIVARNAPQGIDRISTGSISNYKGQYTVRRSVLQAERDSVCIIRDNGSRAGDC